MSGFKPPKAKGGKVRGMGKADKQAASGNLKALCREMKKLRDDKSEVERQETQINGELALLNDKLVAAFQSEGFDSLKIDELGTFYLNVTPRGRVTDEKAFFKDLARRKMMDLAKLTVHPQTLTATIKELRDKGQPDFAGVDIFEQTDVRMRKA